jgi:hypothetical protein
MARLTLVVFLPTLFIILFIYRSSHRAGLISQMNIQLQADLTIMKHTIDNSKMNWKVWCSELPNIENINYTIFRKDGTVVCDSMNNNVLTVRTVFAEIEIGDDVILRKTIPLSSMQENMDSFDQILFLRIVPFLFSFSIN